MITRKEAKAISNLFNSVTVSRMMVETNLQKKDSEEVNFWMMAHDRNADNLMNNFGITVTKYNVRTY